MEETKIVTPTSPDKDLDRTIKYNTGSSRVRRKYYPRDLEGPPVLLNPTPKPTRNLERPEEKGINILFLRLTMEDSNNSLNLFSFLNFRVRTTGHVSYQAVYNPYCSFPDLIYTKKEIRI